MKTKLITRVGGLACIFATTAMPICAEAIRNSISGSSINLGLNATTLEPLGSVLHATTTPLKKNGKKFNKEGGTNITNSLLGQSSPVFDCNGAPGLLLPYVFSYGVTTRQNGDLITAELDLEQDSKVCAFETYFEANVYQSITGGTGEYAGACGWLVTNVKGVFLSPNLESTLSVFEGTSEGEIFVGTDCL
jgi:hypothetical protein